MRRRLHVGAVLVPALLFSAVSAWGQGARIGFVNSQEILFRTNEGSQSLQQLQAYTDQKSQEFESKNRELADLQQEYQAQGPTLSADARAAMERRLEQKRIELRRLQEDIQADLSERQNNLLENISQKVQVVIEEYARQNSFDVIFMRDQSQAYIDPSLDITQDIIRLYNERHPGQAGAATSSPQP